MSSDQNQTTTTPKKITVGIVFSWIFGVLFLILSLGSFLSSIIPGLIFLLMALFILPPINKLIVEKTKFKPNNGLLVAVCLVLFVFALLSTPTAKLEQTLEVNTNNTTQTAESITINENQATSEVSVEEVIVKEVKSSVQKENRVPTEFKSALRKAENYSKRMNMSKKGIYKQLTSTIEGFSSEAAQYAIDNVKADWNKNALAKARNYQSRMNMSPVAIRNQLVSSIEGFTESEADYAIQNLE